MENRERMVALFTAVRDRLFDYIEGVTPTDFSELEDPDLPDVLTLHLRHRSSRASLMFNLSEGEVSRSQGDDTLDMAWVRLGKDDVVVGREPYDTRLEAADAIAAGMREDLKR